RSLPFSRVQMKLHESKRVTNNLTRSFIVILIVERVNALRMICQSECDVSRQGFCHKTIDRIVHCWNLITTGAANEQRRNLARIFLEISYGRESLKGLRRFGLSIIRLLNVHEGVEGDEATHERHLAPQRQRQHWSTG